MTNERLAKAKALGLKSLVWTGKDDDKAVAAAAWPYVGYGKTEDEALENLIRNIEEKREYNQ